MKKQFLLCGVIFTAMCMTRCATTYSLPLFGKIEPKDLCGYPNQCRAGGGNQSFTNFNKTGGKPLLYDGEVKNYLGKLVDIKNPFEQITCINPEKIEYKQAQHVQVTVPFQENNMPLLETKLREVLPKFVHSLLTKAGLNEQIFTGKMDVILQKSKEYLKTTTRGIEYEQFVLKIDSSDLIRADKECQRMALEHEKLGKQYQILSDLIVMTTEKIWKEEFAAQLVTFLRIELGDKWDLILKANGESETSLRNKLEQELMKEASQVFSFAYTPIL